MKHYLTLAILTCLTLSLFLVGCEKKVNENTPIADLKAQVDKMNNDQLRAAALEFKNAIVAKKADVNKIMADIAKLTPDKIGDKKTQLDALNKSITALTERYNIVYNKLKEKGGNTAGLTL